MKTASLIWLVALILRIGASGASQWNIGSPENGSSIVVLMTNARINANVLAGLLQHKCLNDAKYNRTQSYHYYLATTLEAAALKSLYKMAIARLIERQSVEVVAAYVWHIYKLDGRATYALMAEMQLVLFSSIFSYLNTGFDSAPLTLQRPLPTDAYLNHVAYYFYSIQHNVRFDRLEPLLRRGLELAIQSLPLGLRQFYFAPQFCLVNKNYNEYAYSSAFVENERRLIYTWLSPYLKSITSSTQYIWQKHVVDKPFDALEERANFVVSLRSKAYDDFIYVDRTKWNRTFGSQNNKEAEGRFWRVHFVSESFVFEQQGLYMCASSELDYEEKRRYIDGINNGTATRVHASCRWLVRECPFHENFLGKWFGSIYL